MYTLEIYFVMSLCMHVELVNLIFYKINAY